ncbi:MAG: asparagine synthase-related protein [Methanosarcinaceae archaeon]|nr:asparagine synthase-related protein [Methanosarcinaceae archaeon]
MPGLVGIVGKGSPVSMREELHRMMACMYRRNSYASGVYADEDLHAYVGWTCHNGAYADCLPIKGPAGDTTMFFAGEHYSPEGDEEEKAARDSSCSPDKAEVLLALYRKKGVSFFPYLNGFFHGLIIDSRDDRVILFNDRFGMQRLYYYEDPERFYFASEAKSILAVRPELRAFDPNGLGEWLSCGAALEHRSLFRGIHVLPAAARWTWHRDGSLSKRAYFTPEAWESRPVLEQEEFYSQLRSTFVKRLPAYLRSGGMIGLSTTGGLDTRMILANLGAEKSRVHCFSFDGPYRENLDVSIGRRVARAQGLPHTTIRITDDFFKQFGQLAEDVVLSTDGNLDMSGAPNIFVNRIAQAISPIRLTGNYGSEVLRRYHAFHPSNSICQVLQDAWAVSVENAAISWKTSQRTHPLSFVVFRQIPWYSFNRLQAEQSVLNMRSPFMDNSLLEAVYQAPDICTRSKEMSLRLIYDGDRRLSGIMTDRGVTYPKKPSWLMTRAYYEFIFKMEYYASHGMPRSAALIDRHLGPFSLERNYLGRNKYYHLRQWFRDELAPYVRDVLLDERTLSREYFNRHEVIKMVNAHTSGTENNTHAINKLLTMELTNRLLFSASRS